MEWPYKVAGAALLVAAYLYVYRVFLPRLREQYGEENGTLMVILFVFSPLTFLLAGVIASVLERQKHTRA
jgi:cell division protein FtsX